MKPQHLKGLTYHKRLGQVDNAFMYNVDYIMVEPDALEKPPWLFSYGGLGGFSLHESDNGGPRGAGRGTKWARDVVRNESVSLLADCRILLVTQPRVFGHVFNPVSFWLFVDETNALRGVIAEVNNTFGDRHSYLCIHKDLRPIEAADTLTVQKLFYVSPFQPVDGGYSFRFAFSEGHFGVRIDYRHEKGGVVATLSGALVPLTSLGILSIMARRPFGSLRVLGLIYYQALKLRLKGARYRSYTKPVDIEVSK